MVRGARQFRCMLLKANMFFFLIAINPSKSTKKKLFYDALTTKIDAYVSLPANETYFILSGFKTMLNSNIIYNNTECREKSRKLNFSEGINLSRSSVSNSNLIMTNPCTKFQVNNSKDGGEKSGILNFSKGQ